MSTSTPRVLILLILLATAATAQSSAVVAVFADVWSLSPASPETGMPILAPYGPASPADIRVGALGPAPFPWPAVEAPALGFAPADGALADVDGVSRPGSPCVGFPPGPNNDLRIEFSIDVASTGVDPLITGNDPANGGDGLGGDIYLWVKQAGVPEALVLFRNNVFPPLPSLFLLGAMSDIDAWYSQGGFAVGTLIPFPPLLPPIGSYYLTTGPTTPGAYGLDPATIYTPDGAGGLMPAAAYTLPLGPGNDVDALSVGPGVVYFSLSRTSADVVNGTYGAADILKWTAASGMITTWANAGQLGLAPTDNIDALYIWDPGAVTDEPDDFVQTSNTPSSSGNTAGGAWFEVASAQAVDVRFVDASLVDGAGPVAVSVYAATTTGVPLASLSPSDWTLVGTTTVGAPQPQGFPTRIPIDIDSSLACGQGSRWFHISADASGNPGLRVDPTPSGNHVLADDGVVQVRGGTTVLSSTGPGTMVAPSNGAPSLTVYYDRISPAQGSLIAATGGQPPQLGFATLDFGCSLNASGSPVASGAPGPYGFDMPTAGPDPLVMTVTGEPSQPVVLLTGTLGAPFVVPTPLGLLDLAPAGLTVVADGTQPFGLGSLFQTDGTGTMSFSSFDPPAYLAGVSMAFQAAVVSPSNPFFFWTLSNSVVVDFVQ